MVKSLFFSVFSLSTIWQCVPKMTQPNLFEGIMAIISNLRQIKSGQYLLPFLLAAALWHGPVQSKGRARPGSAHFLGSYCAEGGANPLGRQHWKWRDPADPFTLGWRNTWASTFEAEAVQDYGLSSQLVRCWEKLSAAGCMRREISCLAVNCKSCKIMRPHEDWYMEVVAAHEEQWKRVQWQGQDYGKDPFIPIIKLYTVRFSQIYHGAL